MRKEILLPAVAVAGGGAGFVLRRWELATAFEADMQIPQLLSTFPFRG